MRTGVARGAQLMREQRAGVAAIAMRLRRADVKNADMAFLADGDRARDAP